MENVLGSPVGSATSGQFDQVHLEGFVMVNYLDDGGGQRGVSEIGAVRVPVSCL
jgi:hypothetical protein